MKITFNPNLLSLSGLLLAATLLLGSCKKNNNYPVPVNTPQLQINSFAPDSGAMGATVVIHGSGFGNSISGIKVMFNGLPATVSAVSDNSLTVVVPIHAGSGKINVQLNPTHQAASATDFEYLYTVTTLAGSTYGFHEGTGIEAQFRFPTGLTMDAAGNIYVADFLNNLIRKINPTGTVSTPAFKNATGTAAEFSYPTGVAVDVSGNVYVADVGTNLIRKITPAGVVTTLAGDITQPGGYNDATGSAAMFNYPNGVAVDASGNVYVADSGNNLIRKITPAGVVTTVAGDITTISTPGFKNGSADVAQFNLPMGVVADAAGNIYVADNVNNCIRKITPAGIVSTLAGGGPTSYGFNDGTGSAARFTNPTGVAIDAAGNLYVADSGNNRIRKITPSGLVTTIAGDGKPWLKNGIGTASEFYDPEGVILDAAGNIYVVDTYNSCIRKLQ